VEASACRVWAEDEHGNYLGGAVEGTIGTWL
jgi:hypothetical protein